MLQKIKHWAKKLKKKLTALYYARKHPLTPWYCRWLIVVTLLYALSPIDLIPDFIPLLGLLDDLLLLPLAIYISIRLLPSGVWQESQEKARQNPVKLPKMTAGILLVGLLWLVLLLLLWFYWYA